MFSNCRVSALNAKIGTKTASHVHARRTGTHSVPCLLLPCSYSASTSEHARHAFFASANRAGGPAKGDIQLFTVKRDTTLREMLHKARAPAFAAPLTLPHVHLMC